MHKPFYDLVLRTIMDLALNESFNTPLSGEQFLYATKIVLFGFAVKLGRRYLRGIHVLVILMRPTQKNGHRSGGLKEEPKRSRFHEPCTDAVNFDQSALRKNDSLVNRLNRIRPSIGFIAGCHRTFIAVQYFLPRLSSLIIRKEAEFRYA